MCRTVVYLLFPGCAWVTLFRCCCNRTSCTDALCFYIYFNKCQKWRNCWWNLIFDRL